jgi:hypothetical protein
VDRLRSLGYPVHSTSGTAGGYQLGAGATLPPLLLDDDEAVAVALGLRTSASGGVTGIEEASMRALMKLEQVLPPRLRHRVAALHGFIVPMGGRGPTVDAQRLSAIAGACRDQEGIRFSYHNRTGAPSARTVEPHRLVHTGYRWYLVAWDLVRKDWRTFRVDRMEGKLKTSVRFKPRRPPEGGFRSLCCEVAVAGAVSLSSAGNAGRARRCRCQAHSSFGRRAGGHRRPLLHAPHGISLTGGNYDPPVATRRRLRVHEPPELIEYIGKLTERLNRAIR